MMNVIGRAGHLHLFARGGPAHAAAMVLALTAPPARILTIGAPVPSGVVITVEDRERSGRLARLATSGALVYSSVFNLVQLGLVVDYPGSTEIPLWAVVATACYLPFHLHHVYWAAQGMRPPAGGWTLLALAAIVTAALPVAVSNWLPVYAVVAVSAVFVLRWPWSLLVALGVVVGQVPLVLAIGSPLPDALTYYPLTVWWRATALFVPIWLLGAVRQLDAARRSLAEEAVARERLRLDDELRRTVGAALDSIVARGRHASTHADGDPEMLASEVRELVDGSRRALAEARQLISGYQKSPLAAELETAAALLTEAGIRTRIELPHDLAHTTDPAVRSALRTAAATVLHDDTARACVISVTCRDGTPHVELRTSTTTDDEAAS
jgi:two-component system, NarL family, sensor histidine kinase DesK